MTSLKVSEKQCDQIEIIVAFIDYPRAEELKRTSDILNAIAIISNIVCQEARPSRSRNLEAHGMSAERVLQSSIVNQSKGFGSSCNGLALNILFSRC
jgi:hypothetical protein